MFRGFGYFGYNNVMIIGGSTLTENLWGQKYLEAILTLRNFRTFGK